jgi:uncharacterized membrane protein
MLTLLLLLHVFSAIAFFCGMAGRLVTFEQARRAGDVQVVLALLRASDFFERRLTIPASMLASLFGLALMFAGPWGRQVLAGSAGAGWLIVSIVLVLALMPVIPLYLLPARKRRDAAVEAATLAGVVTPELRAALDERGVRAYRVAELAVISVVTWLMIAKPF